MYQETKNIEHKNIYEIERLNLQRYTRLFKFVDGEKRKYSILFILFKFSSFIAFHDAVCIKIVVKYGAAIHLLFKFLLTGVQASFSDSSFLDA